MIELPEALAWIAERRAAIYLSERTVRVALPSAEWVGTAPVGPGLDYGDAIRRAVADVRARWIAGLQEGE